MQAEPDINLLLCNMRCCQFQKVIGEFNALARLYDEYTEYNGTGSRRIDRKYKTEEILEFINKVEKEFQDNFL